MYNEKLSELEPVEKRARAESPEIQFLDACEQGDLEAVKAFIAQDANFLNARKAEHHNCSALHYACRSGNLKLVQYLCEDLHFDPQVKNSKETPAVHYACEYGHLDIVKYLHEQHGVSLDLLNVNGFSCLHMACQSEQVELVQYLSETIGLQIDAPNKEGLTPLHFACMHGREAVVEFLCEKGASIHSRANDRETALHLACRSGNLDIVKFLCETKEFNVHVVDHHETSPLHVVAYAGRVEIAKYLLEYRNANADKKNMRNHSIFDMACIGGHRGTVEYFHEKQKDHLNDNDIKKGLKLALASDEKGGFDYLLGKVSLEFKINFLFDLFSNPPINGKEMFIFFIKRLSSEELKEAYLHACKNSMKDFLQECADKFYKNEPWLEVLFRNSDINCVKFIVERFNIDCNAPIKYRKDEVTWFHTACMNPDFRVVKYLCEQRNADLSACNSKGANGFLIACRQGDRDVVKYLHEEMKQKSDATLNAAVRNLNLDVVKYLCTEMGTKIYNADPNGAHVWHRAVLFSPNIEVVKYLHQVMGQRIHDRTKDGQHALHLACEAGRLDVVKFLYDVISKEARQFDFQSPRQADGKTCLQLACQKGHRDVAQFLFEKLFKNLNPFPGGLDLNCHESVKSTHWIFLILNGLRSKNVIDLSIKQYLSILIGSDIQLLDRMLLKNVFCGSIETEQVYQLDEVEKNQLIRCMLTALSDSPDLHSSRGDFLVRVCDTFFDAFNGDSASEENRHIALFHAVLFLEALMMHSPNNQAYEEQLTVALKFLLHKEQSGESLISMTQNYPNDMRELIDEMSEHFQRHGVIESRILSKLYDSCYNFQLAQMQAANKPLIEQIVALQKQVQELKEQNTRLTTQVSTLQYPAEEDAEPNRKRNADGQRPGDETISGQTAKHAKFMLLGKSQPGSDNEHAEPKNNNNDLGM